MQNSTRNTGLTRFSRRLAILVAALSLALSIGAVAAANAAPQAYTAETGGCCVCRGTEGGDATTIRSCTDGSKVDSCTSQCKAQNADSMAFGYNQTCSQGCAGFPTQNLH